MEKHGDPVPIDLHSLRREFAGPPALPQTAPRPAWEEEVRSLADRAVDFLIPLMIFSMMLAVTWFLLDIRFIYTERLDLNMRVFAFFFVMGIVALNRLRADRGAMDSAAYFVGMLFAVGVFTVVSQLRGGGLAGGVMASMIMSLCFNIGVVGVLWKVTDRLTRDCCVDATTRYGEEGILRGGWFRKKAPEADMIEPEPGKPRLPRRHPANSLFYLAIPIMILLAIGQRLLPQGGSLMETAGSVYVGVYTASMLLLLMLSSYRGLRVYCQRKGIQFPTSIAAFWLGLGSIMVVLVLVLGLWGPVPVKPEAWQSQSRVFDGTGRTISSQYDYHEYQREGGQTAGRSQEQSATANQQGQQGQSAKADQQGQQEQSATANQQGQQGQSAKADQQGQQGHSATANQQGQQGQSAKADKQGQQGQSATADQQGQQGQSATANQQGQQGQSATADQQGQQGQSATADQQGQQGQSATADQQGQQGQSATADQSESQQSSGASATPPSTQIPMNELMETAPAVKWLAYGVLALVGLFFLYFLIQAAAHYFGKAAGRRGRRAGLFERLSRFFRRLTYVPKRKPRRPKVRIDRDIATCARYHNPLNGDGTLLEKIQYSYDAFCALAHDLGVPREEGQTPFEFLDRLPEPIEEMRAEAHTLTHLYVAGSYSTLQLPGEAASELAKFWTRFERLRRRVVR